MATARSPRPVVMRCPGDAHRATADADGVHEAPRVVGEGDHVGCLGGDPATGCGERGPHRGAAQRWGVVGPVAEHHDALGRAAELADDALLVMRQQAATHVSEAHAARDVLRGRRRVTRQEAHVPNVGGARPC